MTVVDSDGNTIVMSVNLYNTRSWAEIRPFMYEQAFPIDCTCQLIQCLNPDRRRKFEAPCPNWHCQYICDSFSQKTFLARILKIVAPAELKLDNMAGLIIWVTGAVASAWAFKS